MFEEVTALSRNCLRDICDDEKDAECKDKYYIVQTLEVKVFTKEENKKSIKQR